MIASLSAYLTDLGRKLIARGLTEGVLLGDWSFQVGSDGYDPMDPTQVLEVDPSLQALLSPIGPRLPLGLVIGNGGGASASLTSEPGVIQINGLSGIPNAVTGKYLSIYGSADPNLNGTWAIRGWIDATSVTINMPLVTAPSAGPLTWEYRKACLFKPNDSACDFHGRLTEAQAVGTEIAEVGIFCRVLIAPTSPSFPLPIGVGQQLLFANSHFPPVTKDANTVINFHVCVQV